MHHNKAFLSNKHNLVPTTPREASLVTLGEIEKMQEPLRCSGLSLSLELSFLGSLRHFTWYGNRSTQLNAIVGTSVTHTSSFRLIYSPAGPQTQSKWALGCPWPGDLCSQWEWGTAHHPPKPGQQHRVASSMVWLSDRQTSRGVVQRLWRCPVLFTTEIFVPFLIIHMTRYIGYYISALYSFSTPPLQSSTCCNKGETALKQNCESPE